MPDDQQSSRDVRVDDPSLSPETNRALTEELQDAVGAERVDVPKDKPHLEHDVRANTSAPAPVFGRNRLLLTITLVTALVIGAILALIAHHWWVILIPLAVHGLGTLLIGGMTMQMTRQVESPGPEVTRRLEDDGVPAAEQTFDALVKEFTETPQEGAGNSETERQQDEMTPGHQPTEPVGDDLKKD